MRSLTEDPPPPGVHLIAPSYIAHGSVGAAIAADADQVTVATT
jgi:hypothetical protein